MSNAVVNRFELPNTTQSLVASLRHILDFINSNLPRHADAASINFKTKIIVTELLTNGLKHSGEPQTCISITVDNDFVFIEKTDSGNPFNPNNHPGLLNNAAGHKAILSFDGMHCIYALVEGGSTIRFICEETGNDTPAVNGLMEHFGLLIITKSADEFKYHYDDAASVNTFTVKLNLS